jgi:hypothetical protein
MVRLYTVCCILLENAKRKKKKTERQCAFGFCFTGVSFCVQRKGNQKKKKKVLMGKKKSWIICLTVSCYQEVVFECMTFNAQYNCYAYGDIT